MINLLVYLLKYRNYKFKFNEILIRRWLFYVKGLQCMLVSFKYSTILLLYFVQLASIS